MAQHYRSGVNMHIILSLLFLFFFSVHLRELPKEFVYLKDIDTSIQQKMMYLSFENFVGEPIHGYKDPTCILTKKAAEALKNIQKELTTYGLSLLVFDCYRPQQAVDHFIEFSKDSKTKTKEKYYPNLTKERMFKEGYVATKSGHSRGSTVDLTITTQGTKDYYLGCINPNNIPTIDFGTGIDCIDPRSNTLNPQVKGQAKINRLFFVNLMKKHGFKNLSEEWWHYTLVEETFPDTYFNFPVANQNK